MLVVCSNMLSKQQSIRSDKEHMESGHGKDPRNTGLFSKRDNARFSFFIFCHPTVVRQVFFFGRGCWLCVLALFDFSGTSILGTNVLFWREGGGKYGAFENQILLKHKFL